MNASAISNLRYEWYLKILSKFAQLRLNLVQCERIFKYMYHEQCKSFIGLTSFDMISLLIILYDWENEECACIEYM